MQSRGGSSRTRSYLEVCTSGLDQATIIAHSTAFLGYFTIADFLGLSFPLTIHTFCYSCLFFWAEHIVVHSLPLQQKGRAAISNEEGMAYQRHSTRKDPGTQNAHGSGYVHRFPLKSHLYDFCGRIPPRSFMLLISRSIHLLFISILVTLVEWPPQRQPTVSNHDNSQTGKATP